MGDNKNFILFAVLSLAFFVGYEYFVLGPKMQRAREAQEAQVAAQAASGATEQAAGGKVTAPDSGLPGSGADYGGTGVTHSAPKSRTVFPGL